MESHQENPIQPEEIKNISEATSFSELYDILAARGDEMIGNSRQLSAKTWAHEIASAVIKVSKLGAGQYPLAKITNAEGLRTKVLELLENS